MKSDVPEKKTSNEGFAPVAGGELTSGEVLLVEAYAAMWLLAFVFIYAMWRRTVALETKTRELKRAVDAAATKEKEKRPAPAPAPAAAKKAEPAEGEA